ncbi:MAG: hypothetical protein NTY53_25345 [Kiritimatiellaeota bacterium]|nr:hypothetical protein [Kiritimatiellota bacterium]
MKKQASKHNALDQHQADIDQSHASPGSKDKSVDPLSKVNFEYWLNKLQKTRVLPINAPKPCLAKLTDDEKLALALHHSKLLHQFPQYQDAAQRALQATSIAIEEICAYLKNKLLPSPSVQEIIDAFLSLPEKIRSGTASVPWLEDRLDKAVRWQKACIWPDLETKLLNEIIPAIEIALNKAKGLPVSPRSKGGPGRKKVYAANDLKRAANMRKEKIPVEEIAREMNRTQSEVRRMLDAARHRQMLCQ